MNAEVTLAQTSLHRYLYGGIGELRVIDFWSYIWHSRKKIKGFAEFKKAKKIFLKVKLIKEHAFCHPF